MHTTLKSVAIVLVLHATGCGALPEREDGAARDGEDDSAAAVDDFGATDGIDGSHDSAPEGADDGRGAGGGPQDPGDPQPEGAPLAEPIPGCAPPPVTSTGDFGGDCVRRINQLRRECQNLPPLLRNEDGEVCADMQAADDARTGVPHGAYSSGMCSGGWGQNECPGWPGDPHDVMNACLQMMWDEGPGPFWEGHGHYVNMTNPAHTSVACGVAVTESGAVWGVQNFQ